MNPDIGYWVTLSIPFLLIPSAWVVFVSLSKRLGREKGYLLGFLFYWLVWCVLVPLAILGWDGFQLLFVDTVPLFSRPNWPAAVLFAFISLVTLLMYGRDFLRASPTLILIAIPAATLNGICEELLWRGLFVRAFPDNIWLAIVLPSIGFALWHWVPLQIHSQGGRTAFVISTFFLGLAYGWISYETGSARWAAVSHSLNGILALGGMIAPSVLKLLKR
ncbi:MAG: CPBP family intramembrane metalloprotease [Chloroflexi bacterium]|nr:CPBP family intramembrane metalloprotease [Chloroflexota bacterium]